MRGFLSAVPWGKREAIYAVAILALVGVPTLLFVFPAPKRHIEAQVELQGLDRERGASVTANEGRDASLEWVSQQEALLTVVAPRDAGIVLSSGSDVVSFTLHDLIIYSEEQWATTHGQVSAKIIGGKLVDWDPNLVQEAYVALHDNRFVVALLAAFSLGYIYVRSRDRFRPLAPLLIVCSLLAYQVLFYLDLTPTLYWDTPLSDPFVRACLLVQMACSIGLAVLWFPLRKVVSQARPDWLSRLDTFLERYGLVILVALPVLQHVIGHCVFGYNLQPTDARYTYMDWGRTMLDRGFLTFLSRGLLRRMETPLLGAVWAVFYKVTGNGYVASALVPILYSELAILCTYLLAREFFNRRVAFYAGLFLSLSPLFSFASYFVMNDVPSAAMAVLTLWVFVVALRRQSLSLAVVAGICLFFTSLTKLTGVYTAFLLIVVYLVSVPRKKRILLTSLAFVVLLPIAFVTPYFLEHGLSAEALQAGGEHLTTWAKRPMFQIRDDEPADWNDMILGSGQIHYYMGPSSKLFYFQYLVNGVGFPIFFFCFLVLVHAIERRMTRHEDIGSVSGRENARLWALVVWILPLLAFVSLWSMRNTRFSYIAFPAYAMLGAYGLYLVKGEADLGHARHSGLVLGLSVIMLSTQSAAHYYNVSYLKNADYRDPIFIEASEPYYYIHRHYAGWHVGWNGAGADHHFTGSISTDGRFDKVAGFELEKYPDVLEVTDSSRKIEFDTWSLAGEDGCDFVVEGGSTVTLDLMIDGVPRPERVYLYEGSIAIRRSVVTGLPLTLPVD